MSRLYLYFWDYNYWLYIYLQLGLKRLHNFGQFKWTIEPAKDTEMAIVCGLKGKSINCCITSLNKCLFF